MNYYTGEIILWPGVKLPDSFVLCDGSLLPISQNQALYSLLGTLYGGDGVNTFGVPNLKLSVPVGSGTAVTTTVYKAGQTGGANSVALTDATIPLHTHNVAASTNAATSSTPSNTTFLGTTANNFYTYQSVPGAVTPTIVAMDPTIISVEGGNQAHNNLQPFLNMSFVICTSGIYPTPAN